MNVLEVSLGEKNWEGWVGEVVFPQKSAILKLLFERYVFFLLI